MRKGAMSPTAFLHDPLTLIIIDKAVLATVLVVAAYFANRRLEAYKAKASLRTKMAERRLDIIAERSTELAAIKQQCDKHLEWMYMSAVNRVSRNQGIIDFNSPEVLEAFREAWASVRFNEDGESDIASDRRAIKTLLSNIERDRFWLGQDRADVFVAEAIALMRGIGTSEGAIEHMRILDELKLDIVDPRFARVMRRSGKWLLRARSKKMAIVDDADVDRVIDEL